jgi:hypothetical protein
LLNPQCFLCGSAIGWRKVRELWRSTNSSAALLGVYSGALRQQGYYCQASQAPLLSADVSRSKAYQHLPFSDLVVLSDEDLPDDAAVAMLH